MLILCDCHVPAQKVQTHLKFLRGRSTSIHVKKGGTDTSAANLRFTFEYRTTPCRQFAWSGYRAAPHSPGQRPFACHS